MYIFKKSVILAIFMLLPIIALAFGSSPPSYWKMQTKESCQIANISAPTNRFIINNESFNNNGTIVDTKTGLMWKQCSEGLRGSDCRSGVATTYTWQEARQHAQAVNNSGGFAGYGKWRVPNVEELSSIVEESTFKDRQCVNFVPTINSTVFPNTQVGSYWSSSPSVKDNNYAWSVSFIDDGKAGSYVKENKEYVRLVRG